MVQWDTAKTDIIEIVLGEHHNLGNSSSISRVTRLMPVIARCRLPVTWSHAMNSALINPQVKPVRQ